MTKDRTSELDKRHDSQKPISIITLAIGIVFCIALGVMMVHADVLDDAVLLEKRTPAYVRYLSQGKEYSCNDENTDNLLTIDWQSGPTSDGLMFTINQDSSITVTGAYYNQLRSFYIDAGNFLSDGLYILSDGENSNSTNYIYSEAWKRVKTGEKDENGRDEEHIDKVPQAQLPNSDVITVDSSSYNWYWFGGMITGAETIDATFYPCINKTGIYSPAWMCNNLGKYKRYIIEIPADEQINREDLALLSTFLSKQYPECSSVEIDVMDLVNGYKKLKEKNIYTVEDIAKGDIF